MTRIATPEAPNSSTTPHEAKSSRGCEAGCEERNETASADARFLSIRG